MNLYELINIQYIYCVQNRFLHNTCPQNVPSLWHKYNSIQILVQLGLYADAAKPKPHDLLKLNVISLHSSVETESMAFSWTVMLPSPSVLHCIRWCCICILCGLLLSTLVGILQWKGWKMLALCFICSSGSDVHPPGDAKHCFGFNRSSLLSASSFFSPASFEQELYIENDCLRCPANSCWDSRPNWVSVRWSHDMESCPQPLSLDLQLKLSWLNGRVH